MRVLVYQDTSEMGRAVADAIVARAAQGAAKVLGVATGSTPEPVYDALTGHADKLRLVKVFALDEYVGLSPDHEQSYRAVVDRQIREPLGLHPDAVHVPDGREDVSDAGEAYEALIKAAGGIDLQLLGIGRTGHVGFNEPGSSLASRTRRVLLAPETREDNARFFPTQSAVPTHSVTQGLGTILEARELILLARGSAKAPAIAAAVEGPISSSCPGSIVQLHPRVTLVLDTAAAAHLTRGQFYRAQQEDAPAI